MPASDDKSHLLIYFANILDPGKTSVWFQTVDTLMVFQEVFAIFILNQQTTKHTNVIQHTMSLRANVYFSFLKKKLVKKGGKYMSAYINELRKIDKMRGLPD